MTENQEEWQRWREDRRVCKRKRERVSKERRHYIEKEYRGPGPREEQDRRAYRVCTSEARGAQVRCLSGVSMPVPSPSLPTQGQKQETEAESGIPSAAKCLREKRESRRDRTESPWHIENRETKHPHA